jgi:hypothetical protein
MKHRIRLPALMFCVAGAAFPQNQAPKPTTKKAVSSSTVKKAPARAGTQKAGTRKTASNRKGAVPRKAQAPAAPPRQLTPTPDRYREIQQALIDKGYLKSEANGTWDAQSSEALLRFQNDQKLAPTGKINAPSLIGLGLGPKTAGTPSAAVPGPNAAAEPVEVPPAPDVLPVPDAAPAR